MEKRFDWLLKIYEKSIKAKLCLKYRTEDEANKEAKSYIENKYPKATDWTLTQVVDKKEAIDRLFRDSRQVLSENPSMLDELIRHGEIPWGCNLIKLTNNQIRNEFSERFEENVEVVSNLMKIPEL